MITYWGQINKLVKMHLWSLISVFNLVSNWYWCFSLLSDYDWGSCGRKDHRRLPSASVLRGFHKEAQQPDQEDLLRPAPAGPSDPQEDDGNHDPWGPDQWPEGSRQQNVSRVQFVLLLHVQGMSDSVVIGATWLHHWILSCEWRLISLVLLI